MIDYSSVKQLELMKRNITDYGVYASLTSHIRKLKIRRIFKL